MTASETFEATSQVTPYLSSVLSFVDSHVRFAEAKNSALLAANAIAAVTGLTILTGKDPHQIWVEVYLANLVGFFLLSALVTLLSFLPRTEIPWLHRNGKRDSRDDLMFFGHIQKYTPDEYLAALCARIDPSYTVGYVDVSYARQVVVNSRIASQKFTYFRYAMWLTVCGMVSPLIAAFIYHWLKTSDTF